MLGCGGPIEAWAGAFVSPVQLPNCPSLVSACTVVSSCLSVFVALVLLDCLGFRNAVTILDFFLESGRCLVLKIFDHLAVKS